MENNTIMEVNMLGGFSILYKGRELNAEMIHSNKIELLLIYMLTHHSKEVLTNELAETLWSEGESDNPLGALKNLMYRLRKLLKDTFEEDDIIATGSGSYTFNPKIQMICDAEMFEEKLTAFKANKEQIKKEDLSTVLNMYKGPFLQKQLKYHWILQQNVYYQSLYISYVKVLIEILEKEKDFSELENWCRKALKYDSLDENLHYYFILTLIKQDKKQLAKEHYMIVKQRLYDELGVSPNENLQSLYQSLLRKDNDRQLDLVVIQKDLKEGKMPNSAYYCDYSVFKEMYRLEARRLQRFGISIYCCLITCDVVLPIPETSKLYASTMQKAMEQVKTLLLKQLRAGDVVSSYSHSQFVLLLPTSSFESMKLVVERVSKAFAQVEVSKQTKLSYDYKEIVLEE